MSDPRNNLWKREAASSFDADDDRRRPNVEPREASSSFDADDRRYSISASSSLSQHALASKVRRLKLARQELRREASELLEHCDAELDRVTRYLGVLADETVKLDRAAVEVEARIATLVSEKKKLFSRLWTSEAGIFSDVQPLVQSALDGFNVSTFAYGQSDSGKTHTMSENMMPADKHKIQKEHNAWLRNELAQLAQLEQDRKLQIQQQDSTIQSLQAKIRSLEHPLNDALLSSETKSKCAVDSGLEVHSLPEAVGDRTVSSIVTKKFEEELKKFDELFEISSPLSKGTANIKTTPEGEYLTAALNAFDPEQYADPVAIYDEGDRLLKLGLVAVARADAPRDREILAEIRDALFSFIRRMERRSFLDTMLVSHARILYIRSLLTRSPELQSINVLPVDCFLEKANSGRSRSSSRGNSPGRSGYVEEQIQGFKVNIKPVKKSKFSSVFLKLRGIKQETGWQHVMEGKLREITEEAKSFSTGNKSLAALFAHTPADVLRHQINFWLVKNFEFLSMTVDDVMRGTSQLEKFSTAIMNGWMAGLGIALPPKTDALGQLLSDYTKRVYTSQLEDLKDIAGTLVTEEAEDLAHVAKLRSDLESFVDKRRQILRQMRNDVAILTLDGGGSPICTAAEDARLASLVSLDGIMKRVKDIMRQSSVNTLSRSKKAAMLASLDELAERMPSLLHIDRPCAQKQISDARNAVEMKQRC